MAATTDARSPANGLGINADRWLPSRRMATTLHHAYHLFVPPGAARRAGRIWREHVAALRSSRLAAALDSMHLCIVGERIDVPPPPCHHTVEHSDSGHETVTLRAIARRAADAEDDALFLYCHSKGVTYRPGTKAAFHAASWRRAMLAHVVRDWRDSVAPLIDGRCDTSGPFYLDAAVWQDRMARFGAHSYFAGNFWWSTAAHIRRLPPAPLDVPRHFAEIWIGLSPQRAFSRSRNVFPGLTATIRTRILRALERNGIRAPSPN